MINNGTNAADALQVLVVDDTPENLRLMSEILLSNGYRVRAAPSGYLALKTVAIELPDLILLDVKMPDMDGYEVCRRLKSEERSRMVPVIFISALDETADKVRAFRAGGVDYVTKPFQREEILARVETHLGLRRLQMHMEELVRQRTAELETLNKTLRESEEKYRNIFENALEGIFQATPEGRFLNVNPAAAKMHGYRSSREMMTSISDIEHQVFVDPAQGKRFTDIIEKEGRVEAFEIEAYKKNGEKIWVSLTARSVCDGDGAILYYEGISEDITERKRAEDEKARLRSQLLQAQKMEALGELASGVAHDFNNILTALIGYGNLLTMGMEADDPLREYADQILASSEKAANLTQSLLAFGRKRAIELKPRNVNTVIRGMEKLLRRLLTEDIELKVMLTEESDASVMADITQLDQVLMNLASNARDAMPRGGRLCIETEETEIDDEFREAHGFGEPGRYVRISVSDTGCGIDEKTKERMFEPFFTTKDLGKGTGLGLAIVYGIVKQHNGYISIHSEPGQGTVFGVYLPAIEGKSEETRQTFQDTPGGTETILVADDSDELRELISEVLAGRGYTVIEAEDGQNAVHRFLEQKDSIDLLILDVVMPNKNGKEAYEEMKKIRPNIKALFISGYTGDVVIDKGVSGDAVDFISKPLSPNELLLKVREVLAK